MLVQINRYSGPSLLVLLACCCVACSSGGSRAPAVAPQPSSPPPAPAPTPTPAPSTNFRTLEYQRSIGLEQIKVVPAYERGGTGAGVLVGIIDTGIDVNDVEFAGRIDPRSADLVVTGIVPSAEARSTPSLQDIDGHGTAVAGILASAKNNLGSHGVAFGASLLVYRGDKKGESGTILGEAIEEGVRRSANLGAGVINLSLGSNEPGVRSDFDFYFNITSANDIFVAISAGNDSAAEPDASALAATDSAARGSVIIVGSVDATNTISSFSNHAGSGANFFLVAPGEQIRAPALGGGDGATVLFSGTSAATPFVSGAAALIRQLWPSLTAAEVADILLTSATDLGASGVDPVYGHGLLNVEAAIAPLGSTTTASVSGATLTVDQSLFEPAPAYGGSVPDFGDFVFLDSYGRDFQGRLGDAQGGFLDLRADPIALLQPFTRFSRAALPVGGATAQFRLESDELAFFNADAALRASIDGDGEERTDSLSVAFTQPLTDTLNHTVSFGFSPREMDMPLANPGLRVVARDAFADAYLPAETGGFVSALNWRADSNLAFDMLVSYSARDRHEYGVQGFETSSAFERPQSNLRVGVTRRFSGGWARLEGGLMREADSLLGGQFAGLFGAGAAGTTVYHSAAIDLGLPRGWRVSARGAAGYTSSDADAQHGFLAGVNDLISTQFSFAAYRSGLLINGDQFRLSASQPLRIESGSVHLIVPTRFDYAADAFVFEDRFAALGPARREIDVEAAYAVATGFGYFEFNLLRQFDAVGAADATTGLARANFSF